MKDSCYKLFAASEGAYCLRVRGNEDLALPYAHLLSLKLAGSRLRIAFSTHNLTIDGSALESIWQGIAEHRIAEIQPGTDGTTTVSSISVEDLEGSADPADDPFVELEKRIDQHLT